MRSFFLVSVPLVLMFSSFMFKELYANTTIHSLTILTDDLISFEGTFNVPRKFPQDGSRFASIALQNGVDMIKTTLQGINNEYLNWHVESGTQGTRDVSVAAGRYIKFGFVKNDKVWTVSTSLGGNTLLNNYDLTTIKQTTFTVNASPGRWIFGNINISGVTFTKRGKDTNWCSQNSFIASNINFIPKGLSFGVQDGNSYCKMDSLLLIKKE